MKKSLLLLVMILCTLDLFPQFKIFSGIYDTQYNYIDKKLENLGFGKVTYYYDDLNKKEGEWKLFPKILLSDSVLAVSISTIEGLSNEYSFIVFYDLKSEQIQDTIGPFFDSYPNAIELINRNLPYLTIRLCNPPEPYEPKYTFIEYENQNSKFIKIRSYNTE
jgi:hypothetical protein